MYKQGTFRSTVYLEEDTIRKVKAKNWKLNRAVNVACKRLRHYIETGRVSKGATLRSQYTRLYKPIKTSVRLDKGTGLWIAWQQYNQSNFIRYALDWTIVDAQTGKLEKTWQIKIEL